jgi:acid phosphatase (class A)
MIFFRQKLHEVITLPKPPVSDLAEAYDVEEIIRVRTPEQVQSIQDHDQEPYYAIRKVCEENNLEFHENEFNQIIKESVPVITHFKDFFNRNRPAEVLPRLNTLPSVTNKTRSYPSGHAAQSVIIARYVAGKVPKLEKELMKAAYECGYGRVLAGFHYVSDYEVGNLLGEKMYVLMNKMDYGQEMNEGKVSFKDFLKN